VNGRNSIVSEGEDRELILVVPDALGPDEVLPVVFLWHWLGGEAQDFFERAEVQAAADAERFIAVIPEAKGDLQLKWPYSLVDSDDRIDEEAAFFDDMLACVADQYAVNRSCVSSAGVSAGALWTSQLAPRRSGLLASFISLSGGVGADGDWFNPIQEWAGAAHAMPALVLWGGPTDFCGVNFQATSQHLEDALAADEHFLLECVHDCSHAEPPLVPPDGMSKYSMLWRFVLDHPFWLDAGASPYQAGGLPAEFPAWCALGAGNARIRDGECDGGVLGSCM
jgi:poly(3-hydroxybutyrate) depolymerase